MIPHHPFESLDVKSLQMSLQHVTDTFEWLTANGDNLFQVMNQLDYALVENMAEGIRALLSNARSVQNAYARINKFPPELLSLIFRFLVQPLAEAAFAPKGLDKVHLPVVSHVCRYWRRIAYATPKLWTTIWIDRQRFLRAEDTRYFLSLSLSRSGSLPLSFYLDGPTRDMELSLGPEVLKRMSRIEDLRLCDLSKDFLLSLSSDADRLQALQVRSTTEDPFVGENPVALFDGWNTPQLQAISMVGCTGWQAATFRHLRHLTIASQRFEPETARTLLHVLSCHPALEDLILSDIGVHSASAESFSQVRERVEMHKLKRLYLRNTDDTAALGFVGLVNSNVDITTPDGCAKYYDLTIPFTRAQEMVILALPPGILGVPSSLAIDNGMIVGTDGQSAFNVTHYPRRRLDNMLLQCANVSDVQELRLIQLELGAAFAFVALAHMQRVSTLVITGYVNHWLDEITKRNLFPQLQDLSLSVEFDTSEPPITHFLRKRKQEGQPIRTLRFVGDHSEARGRPFRTQEFAPYVDRVLLDQSSDWIIMPLPLMCRTECVLPGYWYPRMWTAGL